MPDISLMGAVYPDVPAVDLPKSGGGTARFTDVSDTTAAAADVASGKYFYTDQGVRTAGAAAPSNPVADENDVIFIDDYDGTIRYSYTAAEFANLAALPANPSHDGLTAQGWNWTLSDAKTYVAKYKLLDIGQTYVTDDGETRIYIVLEDGRLSPTLGVCPNGTVTVKWGDGTTDTLTGTSTTTVQSVQHTYANAGARVIRLRVTGSMGLSGSSAIGSMLLYKNSNESKDANRVYHNAIKRVEIGSNVSINSYAFAECECLESVTVPDTITSFPNNSFYQDGSLFSITLPKNFTHLGDYCFQIINGGLNRISIPNGFQSIRTAAFQNCKALSRLALPLSVTLASTYALYACTGINQLVLGPNLATYGSGVLYNCCGLARLYFEKTSPATISNSNVFNGLPTDCIIYVPYSADHSVLQAYKTATNYPDQNTYTYMEMSA